METLMRRIALLLLGLGLLPAVTNAQTAAATGSRAAGMGGAFTAVADDASALYWNPAGLAAGAIVSAVLDVGQGEAAPNGLGSGHGRSSVFFGLATPALGLGYYRLRSTNVWPGILFLPNDEVPDGRNLSVGPYWAESLVTHHAGVTLVQSIVQGVAVGSTLKLVRGIAGAQIIPSANLDAALDDGADIIGRATNRFDLDVGVIAYGGPLKAGLTIRNLREPHFPTAGEEGREFVLDRQARAGLSYMLGSRWMAAVDLDLTQRTDVFGDYRELSLGTEGQITQRFWVRSGLRLDTADDEIPVDGGRRAAFSVGGSYAARAGLLVDGHFSAGDERTGHQWGIAARFVY